MHPTQPTHSRQAIEPFKTFLRVETPDALRRTRAADEAERFAIPHPWSLAPLPRSRYNPAMPSVSQTVRVKVLFFGRLKDVVGQSEESLDLNHASTIEQLFALYSERIPELAKYRSSVVASRNQEFAPWDTLLHSGDEVAFLPPVSGG